LPGTSAFCEMIAPADFHGTHPACAGVTAAVNMTAVDTAMAACLIGRQIISVPLIPSWMVTLKERQWTAHERWSLPISCPHPYPSAPSCLVLTLR